MRSPRSSSSPAPSTRKAADTGRSPDGGDIDERSFARRTVGWAVLFILLLGFLLSLGPIIAEGETGKGQGKDPAGAGEPLHGQGQGQGQGQELAIINPHLPPDSCDSCHVRLPTKEEAAAGNYRLLKESIDGTCRICHPPMCCEVGSLHTFNHPSDFDKWDRTRFRRPKTLPLHNGKITCATCHFHLKKDGPTYRMVRIVQRDRGGIQWIYLCRDCHTDK